MQFPRPRAMACGLAVLAALALAVDLLWMPIQVSDSLGEILDAQQSSSAWASFTGSFGTGPYLRPLRIAQIKALFDSAQDRHFWLVYRGFHVLLVVAALLLFTRALRVATITDAGAAACALAVLLGLHTFRGAVQEAYPINHFLEIAVFCLVALNLAQSRGGPLVDLAAAATFAAAALTLESGLLVWVVAAAAWLAGWRGISTRGLAAMTLLLAGYAYLRFVYLSTGVPALSERSSGYLLSMLDPPELQERFGAQPVVFYAYNVASSVLSVLFSEPQGGVFVAVRAWLDDRVMPRIIVPLLTSLATTSLIVWAGLRRAAWRPLDDTARLLLVFVAVLAANAALSFAYTKDEIMSAAGMFYALAAYAAFRHALEAAASTRRAVAVAAAVALVVLVSGWSLRAVGVHYVLRSQAVKHQLDWLGVPGQMSGDPRWGDPARRDLVFRLRGEALALDVPNTRADQPEWPSRLWLD